MLPFQAVLRYTVFGLVVLAAIVALASCLALRRAWKNIAVGHGSGRPARRATAGAHGWQPHPRRRLARRPHGGGGNRAVVAGRLAGRDISDGTRRGERRPTRHLHPDRRPGLPHPVCGVDRSGDRRMVWDVPLLTLGAARLYPHRLVRRAHPPYRAAARRHRSQPARGDDRPEHRTANTPLDTEAWMKLLKTLVSFIVGTIAGALGSKLFGPFGAILGFIAGGVAAWWVAQKIGIFE